jgi:farnesol kinase
MSFLFSGSHTGVVNKSSVNASATLDYADQPQKRVPRGEILRKFLHMSPGLIPFLMKDMPHLDPLDKAALVFLTVVSIVLTIIFLAVFRLVRRPGESNLLSAALSYPATVVGTIVLFPANLEFACVVVTILAFGDGFAYLCGRLFGKTRLPWNPQKTWLGSLGFVLFSGPIASLAFWVEAKPQVSMMTAVACGFSAAIAGAIAESLDVRLTDNLRVGLAAAFTVAMTSFWLS